jgi:hypothetical protein
MAGFLFLAQRRRKRVMAEQLNLHTLASRGDGKDIKKALRDWSEN